jgi:hypothetical protein
VFRKTKATKHLLGFVYNFTLIPIPDTSILIRMMVPNNNDSLSST